MTKRIFTWILSKTFRPKKDKWYAPLKGRAVCDGCGRKTRRGTLGIRGPNENKVFCVRCYLKEVPEKVDRALARLTIPLFFITLSLATLTATALGGACYYYAHREGIQREIIRYEFGNELKIGEVEKEAIVDYFYNLLTTIARRDDISRGEIRTQVEAALKTKFPLLMLAIIYREALFDPRALGKWVVVDYKGKKIKTRARGNTQVLPTWVDALVAAGIIDEERDLHAPEIGPRAGEYILCRHLENEEGDLLMAVKAYVGSSKPDPLNVQYVRDVFETYGELRLLLMSTKKERESNVLHGQDEDSGKKDGR